MSNGPRYRGKTFHEYMSAKFWHPASKRNIVTVWKRKQQMEAEKRKNEARGEEARRENERNLVRKAMGDKKAINGVSFLYDMPNNIMPRDINAPENQGDRPGMTAKNFEIKFDWQKNAPRDSHFNDMGEVRNSIFNHKPFGIEVRNVKCLKCGEWGHSNFDRVCPLFGKVGDRDNPEFDVKAEQIEILSSRLLDNQGYKLKKGATQHVGDIRYDPMNEFEEAKKKGQLELEFLKKLDPQEKEALLERLEKERKRKKKKDKKKRNKAKLEIQRELAKNAKSLPIKNEPAPSEILSDDDDDEQPGPSIDIALPKRKIDLAAQERLAAKKEFAKKLAEVYAQMNQDSDSDSDSSESDSSDSDSEDSDYETKSSSGSLSPTEVKAEAKEAPKGLMAPPKPGMVLVKRKRTKIDVEEEKAKKQKLEKLKMLEMTKILRKKMEEKQKLEMEKQQKKLKAIDQPGSSSLKPTEKEVSEIVSDTDLTSGLLDFVQATDSWKPNPLISYDSDSD